MAEHQYCFLNLIEIMDHLWFHQIILISQPISLISQSISETPSNTSSNFSSAPLLAEAEILSDLSQNIPPKESKHKKKRRPKRSILVESKPQNMSGATTLKKTMSCKSLWELEYEEIKGFMDLGFTFKKEQLSPRMMSVIPGLQRLGKYLNEQELQFQWVKTVPEESKEDEVEDLEERESVMRPYLSEAWLIKRPDSPLLNLKMPPVSATINMKKHLRFWARTVASAVQREY